MSHSPPASVQQRSVTPNRDIPQPDSDRQTHWSQALYECEVFAKVDGSFEFIVEGGSDNGEFPFFGTTYHDGYKNISKDDILLEIQGQKVAGYTQRDVISWLTHCARNGNIVKIKAVKTGYLTKDLRQYLNTRFQKGSLDHDLQNTIRDNLYLRTVPCTTRTPRCGEINGVDYTFLSVEEFIALERSGNLLESGIYEGNLYGTPRPAPAASAFSASISNLIHTSGWSLAKSNHYGTAKTVKENNSLHSPARRNSSVGSSIMLPGAHASSEGKRRRNRSNVEAMASKTSDVSEYSAFSNPHTRSSTPVSTLSNCKNNEHLTFSHSPHLLTDEDKETTMHQFMGNGEAYLINNGTSSHWLDPRLSRVPPTHIENFCDNDLPFGWERIDDPHYGTYYIDHVNRRTQYENPVLHAGVFDHSAVSKEFSSRSLSWRSKSEQRSDNSRSSCMRSPCSDSKISPRTSRNSSLTQTTNRDSLTPANTNSESPLIDSNSSSLPLPLAASQNPISSSPASTHRFPYLHCIPCLSEKHDPKHRMPADGAKSESGVIPNGTISSDAGFKRTEEVEGGNPVPSIVPNAHFNPLNDSSSRELSRLSSLTGFNAVAKQPAYFTQNPNELKGLFIRVPLLKSSRGLGFTIIGGDNPTTQEFLQIKDVVPYGPAWCDGKLQTGDILVYVNSLCVLGYSHKSIVSLFQSIPSGNVVHLEVCRGYPLPFDPNDPNNEIVTTVAVSVANAKGIGCQNVYSTSQPNTNSKLMSSAHANYVESMSRTAKSMPDLSSARQVYSRHNSAGVLTPTAEVVSEAASLEYITVEIIKGTAGFGFTIADSSYGQKVKKILDRPRCKQLQEGDILVEINGREVQSLPHTEVVQILKDCPCGDEARIAVQRGNVLSVQGSKARPKVKDSTDEFRSRQGNDRNETSFRGSRLHQSSSLNSKDEKLFNGYRSKTPTAELYSSRDKDTVVVSRPKTPLVDSRNWVKSSPSVHNLPFDSERLNPNFDHFPRREKTISDFKDGAQLDRETTNYLMFEPTHQAQNRKLSWYTNKNHSRSTLCDQSFNDFNYLENSDIFASIDEGHINSDFDNTPNFIKNTHVKDYITSSAENDLEVSKTGTEVNFTDTVLSKTEQQILFQPKNENQQPVNVNSHAFYNSSKVSPDESISCFFDNQTNPKSNFQFSNTRTKHMFSHNDDAKESVTQSFPPKVNGNSSDTVHQKKRTTSFDLEYQVSCDTQDQSVQSYQKNDNCLDSVDNYVNMVVTLYRQNSGFGFRILGGTEEGSQVSVGHIVSGGAADLDGRLQTGDEILGVDGQSVLNSSHRHVVELMNNAAANGKVTLHLRRLTAINGNDNSMKSNNSTYEVTVTRTENEGFGFVLISSLNRRGSTIGRIIEGSPADRCGQLSVGNVIEAVNGVSILNMHHGDIVSLIKECGNSITLSINNMPDNTSSIASVSQKGGDSFLDPDDSYYSIELQRGTKGFGFSIRGGREFHNMPLFVLRIAENGPAHQDGRIQVNDEIIEINGVSTKNMTHAEAIDLIREGGPTVRLLVKRNSNSVDSSGPSHHQYFHLMAQSSSNSLPSPITASESVFQAPS